jgi:hypothetical protein
MNTLVPDFFEAPEIGIKPTELWPRFPKTTPWVMSTFFSNEGNQYEEETDPAGRLQYHI